MAVYKDSLNVLGDYLGDYLPADLTTDIAATGQLTGPGSRTRAGGELRPDGSGQVPDKACVPLEGAGQARVYAGSGFTAVAGQRVADQPHAHLIEQIVVAFSSARDTRAFFAASAQHWPACANRQHDENTTAGQRPTISGILARNGTSAVWERALTVANNVAIDIDACGQRPSGAAVNIADQIAAKVTAT
jgi:hypothetical protein